MHVRWWQIKMKTFTLRGIERLIVLDPINFSSKFFVLDHRILKAYL